MKKVTLLIALLFILSACQSRTPALAEVLPTPSRTPSPTVTPTPNATERYQGTLQANQTQNAGYALTQGAKGTSMALTRTAQPTATLTPTITPTAFPSPTPTPLPVTNYRLSNPDQNTLIQLMMNVIEERSDDPFVRVLDYEWERNFANMDSSLFSLDSLPKEDEQEEKYFWFYPSRPESFYDFLAVITTNFINQKALHLKNLNPIVAEGFKVQPYLVEIDGDAEPEWLVYSDFRDISTSVWLTLDQIGDGQYRLFKSGVQGIGGGHEVFYEASRIEDFTEDGLTDVVLALGTYFGGGLDSVYLQFLQGTPEGFELIDEVSDRNGSPTDDTTYDWILNDENVPVFRIINDFYKDWCRETTYREFIWQADGVKELAVPNLPESAECAIARAMYGFQDNLTTIHWLEVALEMEAARPQLSLENIVYIHYSLALAYALEGNETLLRQHLNFIMDFATHNNVPIATNLAAQLKPVLSESKIYPILLCRAAQEIALPVISDGLFTTFYPYEGMADGYPTPLCDMRDYQEDALNQLVPHPSGTIKEALENAGFSVLKVQAVSLGQAIPSWFVILQEHLTPVYFGEQLYNMDRQMAYLYTEDLGWQSFGQFFLDKPLEQINADVTGDGIAELAFAQPAEDVCDEHQSGYDLSLVSSIGNGGVVAIENLLCLPDTTIFDWNLILQDQNGDGLVDWLVDDYFADYDLGLLANYPPPTPSIFDWWKELSPLIYKPDLLASLDEQFFTSPTPSLLRSDLEFYLTRWGTGDDPASEQIYAHLTYLLALTYELEGDETQAIERFYDLWANHPDTLWAYLAAARLTLK